MARLSKRARRLLKPGPEPKLTRNERALLSEHEKKFDPGATAEDCLNDLRTVQERNPLRTIDRNFYRNEGLYSDATWNQFFGTFHEFSRQAKLRLSRQQHQIEREIAKHASLDHYRRFYHERIEPLTNLYQHQGPHLGMKTLLAGSDFHDVEADPWVLATFIAVAKDLQPDVILLNGDVFDLYEFSRFDKDPRRCNPEARGKFVKQEIFAPLRNACPQSRITFNLGNHEWRLLKHMADATPHLRSWLSGFMDLTLEDMFGVKEYEIELNCKWDLAAYKVTDINHQVKQNHVVYWECFVASHLKDFGFGLSGTSGHIHTPGTVSNYNLAAGGAISWTTTGCIRSTNEDYVVGPDKHINGFGLFHVHPEKRWVMPENILIPGDVAAIAGRYYQRPLS